MRGATIQTQDWKLRGCLIAAITCEKRPGSSVTAVPQLRKYTCLSLKVRDFAHLLHPPTPPWCISMHCTLLHSQMHMILQEHLIYQAPLYPDLLGMVLTSGLLLSRSRTSTLAIVAMSPPEGFSRVLFSLKERSFSRLSGGAVDSLEPSQNHWLRCRRPALVPWLVLHGVRS